MAALIRIRSLSLGKKGGKTHKENDFPKIIKPSLVVDNCINSLTNVLHHLNVNVSYFYIIDGLSFHGVSRKARGIYGAGSSFLIGEILP